VAGFQLASANINPQRGVRAQTAFQELQMSTRQSWGARDKGAGGHSALLPPLHSFWI